MDYGIRTGIKIRNSSTWKVFEDTDIRKIGTYMGLIKTDADKEKTWIGGPGEDESRIIFVRTHDRTTFENCQKIVPYSLFERGKKFKIHQIDVMRHQGYTLVFR